MSKVIRHFTSPGDKDFLVLVHAVLALHVAYEQIKFQ